MKSIKKPCELISPLQFETEFEHLIDSTLATGISCNGGQVKCSKIGEIDPEG